jgi:hypothetical protein
MSWNNIPDGERLHLWKVLRSDISSLPFDEQLDKVAKFFAHMPYGSRSLDYYSPTEWPTPWEIIFHGKLCKSSISLLMFYTFSLLHTNHKVELQLIDDSEDEYLLLVINDQFVLNYQLGVVSNYSDVCTEFTHKQTFTEQQIKKIA